MKITKAILNANERIKTKIVFSVSLALLLPLHPAMAQQPFLIDVSSCVVLESILERYECYEKQVDIGASEISAGTQSTIITSQPISSSIRAPEMLPSSEASTITTSSEDRFGLPEETMPQAEDVSELTSTISELREFAPNYQSITLVNGQVWRQTVGKNYRLREGQEVRIYPTGWGKSFRLSVESLGGFIQVERVK